MAMVKVNESISTPFSITHSTRQGCPLSPLIFILTLEPLIRQIQKSAGSMGFPTTRFHHKTVADVDDLLFYISRPTVSLPNLIAELDKYGSLSNFKIHYSKSKILNIFS